MAGDATKGVADATRSIAEANKQGADLAQKLEAVVIDDGGKQSTKPEIQRSVIVQSDQDHEVEAVPAGGEAKQVKSCVVERDQGLL